MEINDINQKNKYSKHIKKYTKLKGGNRDIYYMIDKIKELSFSDIIYNKSIKTQNINNNNVLAQESFVSDKYFKGILLENKTIYVIPGDNNIFSIYEISDLMIKSAIKLIELNIIPDKIINYSYRNKDQLDYNFLFWQKNFNYLNKQNTICNILKNIHDDYIKRIEKIDKIIKKWKNMSQDDILRKYNCNNLSYLFNERSTHMGNIQPKCYYINKSMRLYIYSDHVNNVEILESLIYRYPNYNKKNINNIKTVNLNIKYGIFGLNYNKNKKCFFSYHISCINLESVHTNDSRYFLDLKNTCNDGKYTIINSKKEEYLNINKKMYQSIFITLGWVNLPSICSESSNNILIKILIENNLNMITEDNDYKLLLKNELLDIIYAIILENVLKYKNIKKILCQLIIDTQSQQYLNNKNNFNQTNIIFNELLNNNYILLVVNELDSKKFINKKDSSFLHNPFISYSLLDHHKWFYVPDYTNSVSESKNIPKNNSESKNIPKNKCMTGCLIAGGYLKNI